jgi:hypothetical protein
LLSNFVRAPPTAALVGALALVLAVLPAILRVVSILVTCVAFPALLGSVELVALGAFAFAQVYAVLCFVALLATLPTSGVTLLPGRFGMRHASKPILTQPTLTDQYNLEVDTSGFAVGAVLLQKKADGKRHPVGYYSATLNTAEHNYDIYNLELLAIVKALRHWRYLLAGAPHKTCIYSDHMNLLHWREPQKISRRVAREVLEMEEFPIKIHHIQGKKNGRADALSRRPDYDQGEEDNQDVTVLPDSLFARALMEVSTNVNDQEEAILKPWINPHELKKIEGVWYKNVRQVVTTNLRGVIRAHHNTRVNGHPGIARTIQLVKHAHWWLGLRRQVTDYIKGCAECQHMKV